MGLERLKGEDSEAYAARIAAGTTKLREGNQRLGLLIEGIANTTAFKDAVVADVLQPRDQVRGMGL